MPDEQKKKIREQIRNKKNRFFLEEKKRKSASVMGQVEKLDAFLKSKIVMAYWSMDDEVFTHDFILKYCGEKQIILPVVKGDNLVLKKFTGLSNMEPGESFGIGEPVGEHFENIDQIDMIIIPGIAFDKNLNRLGRGKAYYDKLLKKTKALKVGVCFDFQLLSSVPINEHDVKMDLIITD
ncbi:MAG: 5-formyltetrahydrofolate cyclo-ligase [Bacteroidales bacterium]|nr:5-formyltetrahydrofolate cyclo-ligase [Bacteroidales bacterium]